MHLAKCPHCQKEHELITQFAPVVLLICPLIPSALFYLNGVQPKSVRLIIKETLGL